MMETIFNTFIGCLTVLMILFILGCIKEFLTKIVGKYENNCIIDILKTYDKKDYSIAIYGKKNGYYIYRIWSDDKSTVLSIYGHLKELFIDKESLPSHLENIHLEKGSNEIIIESKYKIKYNEI